VVRRAQPRAANENARPAEAPEIDRSAGAAVALRLAIGKDGLGIELARGIAMGPLDVVELVVRLPNVRFPFDVTGGVTKFRNRRGELERLSIELDSRKVARWAAPLLRGLLSPETPAVTIAPRAFGATITLLAAPIALAFEVALVGDALVVHGARGAALPAPATALALRALSALLGPHARREGARFILARAAGRIARALLPDAGVRAPGGEDVVLAGSGESDGVLFVTFRRGPAEPAIPRPATLANEAALLTRAGDDARFSGDYDRARHHDLATLERAPRHGEIARRIAEVDAHVGGRAEAAIATLRGAERLPYQGLLLGDLLAEAGDPNGAIAALLREGERDPSAPVAAFAYARAAALATNPSDALQWLDAALGRAPALLGLRWERASQRLSQGRLADARADFQELEAVATGAAERFAVLRRAADIYRARGLAADAALLYERALLYRPDEPESVAGLGIALAAEGRGARGATLIARAIELAEKAGLDKAWMELALARVLGDRLNDRPAAVARLRAVPDDSDDAIEARGLEGRYRAALGDLGGASLAFARLRERAGRDQRAIGWLEEAATFEEGRGELTLAQQHLSVALAIAPHNTDLDARFRAISARLVKPKSQEVRIAILPEAHTTVIPLVGGTFEHAPKDVRDRTTLAAPPEDVRDRTTLAAPASLAGPTPTPEEDEMKVEALTRTLQGDPTNDAVVDELCERLTRLGRGMELLALLSARLEDAPAERREELLPRHRAVLERLELEARAAGRDGEADLFRMARDAAENTDPS
jgi:tetratricopeptide (TPR) repeat protein